MELSGTAYIYMEGRSSLSHMRVNGYHRRDTRRLAERESKREYLMCMRYIQSVIYKSRVHASKILSSPQQTPF